MLLPFRPRSLFPGFLTTKTFFSAPGMTTCPKIFSPSAKIPIPPRQSRVIFPSPCAPPPRNPPLPAPLFSWHRSLPMRSSSWKLSLPMRPFPCPRLLSTRPSPRKPPLPTSPFPLFTAIPRYFFSVFARFYAISN